MIIEGQVYESVSDRVPAPGRPDGIPRRIRIAREPIRWHGKVFVETVQSDGRRVRGRWMETSDLHASAMTRYGEPRRRGYVLVPRTE